MRNFFRIMAAVVLAAISIASIGGVAVAATGSITGYVHADNGSNIQSAKVVAYVGGINVGEDLTGADGVYTITNLPPGDGDCELRASAIGFFTEWYSGGVSVPDGGVATANFSLTPGLTISGYVYKSDNVTPLQGIRVVSLDSATHAQGPDDYSSADGSYSITVEPGSYHVRARTNGWKAQFWDNRTDEDLADVVTVDASDITGIDFSLTQTGYISGTVYKADGGTFLDSASVSAYDNSTGTYVYKGSAGASNGYYYINLDPGTYRILAYTEPVAYVPQWWNGSPQGVQVVTENVDLRNAFWDSAAQITLVGLENNPDHNFTMLPAQAVTTNGATDITTAAATLNANLTSMGASTSDNVSFEWGLTDAYGNTTTPVEKTATGAFSASLTTGLSPNTTYHFRAKAEGYVTSYGDDVTFITSDLGGPEVTTSAATNLATVSATLNGDLTAMGTASSVTVSFAWGTTDLGPYPNSTDNQTKTSTGAFSADLSGLTAKTTYYYIAKAVGDGSVDGAQMTFTTLPIAPTVTTSAATNVATTSATLNCDLTAMGTATSVSVSFEWGTTTSYGNTTTAEAKTTIGTYSASLTGLTANTTYHFRAIAVGDGTTYGDDLTFTTSTVVPSVTTSAATSLAATSATLNGNLAALGTATTVNVSFEWGTTTSYGSVTTAEAKTAIGAYSASLTGLAAKTMYHFRAKAVGDGSAVYGDDMTFTTIDATAPVISVVNSSDITKTGVTITWTTDEAADSQVEYGLTEEYGSTTTLDASAVTSHSVVLTGLKAGKTYHYRVISKDADNNQAVSADGTFKTTASSGGMPVWAWVLIGLAAVGVIGGGAYFASTKMAQK